VRALVDALDIAGVEPEQLDELSIGRNDHDRAAGGLGPSDQLPLPLTPLVGRAADVAALADMVSARSIRLLTLTGVAGVGKSRLPIEVVRQLQQRGRHA
jgi:hypothetical protein